MERSHRIAMVGDKLTQDITFGNLNDMATVWVYEFSDSCRRLETKSADLFIVE